MLYKFSNVNQFNCKNNQYFSFSKLLRVGETVYDQLAVLDILKNRINKFNKNIK